jgi:hypothetical protein
VNIQARLSDLAGKFEVLIDAKLLALQWRGPWGFGKFF